MSKKPKVEERNINDEYSQTIAAQLKAAPQILEAQQKYAPQYTALNTQLMQQAMAGGLDTAKSLSPQYIQQSAANEQQAIASNPLLAALYAQGLEQVNLGGSLSAEERLAAQEASRSQFAQRGTLGSNASLLDQILSRGQYSQNRLQQRLSNAQSIYGTTSGAGANANSLLAQLMGTSANTVTQANINPESAYAADVYNTNVNAKNAAAISQANNRAGLIGGTIGGLTGMFSPVKKS